MTTAITGWVRRHDPQLVSLHRAVRMAVVVPVALGIGVLISSDPQLGIFASFGAVAFMLFVDFPGSPSARWAANLAFWVVGAVEIVIATLFSQVGWLAVVSMTIAAFAITFAGIVSAAIAAARRAALLAFVLPVTIPADFDEVGPRLIGWAIAGLLAIPAVMLVWPPRQYDAIRSGTASACRELGAWLRALAAADPQASDEGMTRGFAAVNGLRMQFRSAESRPVGLTTGSRLLSKIVGQLDWMKSNCKELGEQDPSGWDERTREIVTSCADILDASAEEISRATAPAEDGLEQALARLEHGRRNAVALVDLGAAHASGTRPATVHELVYSALQVGSTILAAASADRRSLADRLLGRNRPSDVRLPLLAAGAVVARRVNVRSVWLQNSVRTGAGLGLAVLIVQVTHVTHGFWVGLAAMSVLRTTAIGTGANALRALLGTLLGFAIGAALVVILGTGPVALWSLLPITLLVAGFAPTAISFAAGQAAFTVLVVVLFNIVDPVGWTVGEVRIEDVALGSLAGIVCGVLLWPSGAASQLRTSLGEAYRSAAGALVAATADAVGRAGDGGEAARREIERAQAAAGRLDDAFRSFLTERGSTPQEFDSYTATANVASKVGVAAQAIEDETVPEQLPTILAEATETVLRASREDGAWFDGLAAYMEGSAGRPGPTTSQEIAATVIDQVTVEGAAVADPGNVAGRALWSVALHLDAVAALQMRVLPHARHVVGDE